MRSSEGGMISIGSSLKGSNLNCTGERGGGGMAPKMASRRGYHRGVQSREPPPPLPCIAISHVHPDAPELCFEDFACVGGSSCERGATCSSSKNWRSFSSVSSVYGWGLGWRAVWMGAEVWGAGGGGRGGV